MEVAAAAGGAWVARGSPWATQRTSYAARHNFTIHCGGRQEAGGKVGRERGAVGPRPANLARTGQRHGATFIGSKLKQKRHIFMADFRL
ncbi:hypothetical protein E2C01_094462 [Portunus trituberculatus]|uniref:Uncharacterized protein n=1 Tax=Portunus trituberculatus TaxID=210409 RepID=A0A5B7K0S1_PORTR|nr:hypothetical protein [Portunus trituberculatus]